MTEPRYTRESLKEFQLKEQEDENFKYIDILYMAGITPVDTVSGSLHPWQKVKEYNESPIKVYNDITLHDRFIYLDKTNIDFGFFKKQYDFLLSLTEEERRYLTAYTDHDGYKIVRDILKIIMNKESLEKIVTYYKGHTAFIKTYIQPPINISTDNPFGDEPLYPDFTTNQLYEMFMKYYNTLIGIIEKAPRTGKDMRLFRGVVPYKTMIKNPIKLKNPTAQQSEKYTSDFITVNTKSADFKPSNIIGFTSTTYGSDVGLTFLQDSSNREYSCCLFDIIVKAGTPAIWLSPISVYLNKMTGVDFLNNSEREFLFFCYPNFVDATVKLPGKSKELLGTGRNIFTYDVTIAPSASIQSLPRLPSRIPGKELLGKWKAMSTKVGSEEQSFKGSMQGTSRRKKTIRKHKNTKKTRKSK